jgi:hypothetical protein
MSYRLYINDAHYGNAHLSWGKQTWMYCSLFCLFRFCYYTHVVCSCLERALVLVYFANAKFCLYIRLLTYVLLAECYWFMVVHTFSERKHQPFAGYMGPHQLLIDMYIFRWWRYWRSVFIFKMKETLVILWLQSGWCTFAESMSLPASSTSMIIFSGLWLYRYGPPTQKVDILNSYLNVFLLFINC